MPTSYQTSTPDSKSSLSLRPLCQQDNQSYDGADSFPQPRLSHILIYLIQKFSFQELAPYGFLRLKILTLKEMKAKSLFVWFGRLGTHRCFYKSVIARVYVLGGLAKDQENLEKSHFVTVLDIIMKCNYYQEILAPISYSNGFLEVYWFAFSFPLFV